MASTKSSFVSPRKGLTLSAILTLITLAMAMPAHDPQITTTAAASRVDDAGTLMLNPEIPLTTQPPLYQLYAPHDLKKRADDESSSDSKDDKTSDSDTDKATKQDSESHPPTSTTATQGETKTIASSVIQTVSSLELGTTTTATTTTAASASVVSTNLPLPSPFDGVSPSGFQSAGSNDACSTFMKDLLASSAFQACYPLSMMLQTSTSFFDAEKQLFSIVRVLDATCAANSSQCATYLNSAAANLTTEANCKTEYDAQQSLVLEAYQGLRAYETLYTASCLQDPDQDMYCFATAVTNVSRISDTYLYFLPYGSNLPGASTPSCDWCTRQTMAVYHAASADRSNSVSGVYVAAAQQVNTICGVSYVNATLPSPEASAGSSVRWPSLATTVGSLLAAVALTVLL